MWRFTTAPILRRGRAAPSRAEPELLIGAIEEILAVIRLSSGDPLAIWGATLQQRFDAVLRQIAGATSAAAGVSLGEWTRMAAACRQLEIENHLMWMAWEQRRYPDRECYERRIIQRLETCLGILKLAMRRAERAAVHDDRS